MNRRDFLKRTSLVTGLALAPGFSGAAYAASHGAKAGWRTFELTTKVNFGPAHGSSRIWLPVPRQAHLTCQTSEANTWKGNFTRAALHSEPRYGAQALFAEWDDNGDGVQLEFSSRVSLRDVSVDLGRARQTASEIPADVALYLKPTPSSPTDGVVLDTARKIAKGKETPIQKAQAVYDWILENGVRDPNTKGCGTGDVVGMLESGNVSGKCADLNGLFVALVRALGVPARDVYGIRIADSRHFKSLGKSGDLSKSQHCRAEFYLSGLGWVPVDPADVLKVALEEKLSMESPQISSERARQFGSWEMNWVAYNTARDFNLNPPGRTPLEFFMYPRAETRKGVLNHLDPAAFGFSISSKQIEA